MGVARGRFGLLGAAIGLVAAAGCVGASQGFADDEQASREFVVLYDQSSSAAAARAAVDRAGGTVVAENTDVGVATVRSANGSFVRDVRRSDAIAGAAGNRTIGKAPDLQPKDDVARLEALRAKTTAGWPKPPKVAGDPLSGLQWDMQMIHATPKGSYKVEQGSPGVLVGVIDTGIDASHPDIAPNLDLGLSRNFTVDDPVIDGPCASDPDHSCQDPPTVDEDSHGTHVAGTIASPLNGIGIGGVAPRVRLVNLRAGQDSGYFFLQPTVDALTFAADHGVDVVNMSFYIDPWLFNCAANPADSPDQQQQQRTIIAATQRALAYAREHDVTLIAAEGNENTDLGHPTTDPTSPDYPPDTAHTRTVDNSCLSLPTEGTGVIGVTALGRSGRKAYYSDYGIEQADVSAPGGDDLDFPGTSQYGDPANLIVGPYPESVGRTDPDGDGPAVPDIDANGNPTTPFVIRDDSGGKPSYYQYIEGTSMAAPHATGVAALIVSRYGRPDPVHGGLTLAPDVTEKVLRATATDTACPPGGVLRYPEEDLPADDPNALTEDYTATCEGTPQRNGFYGDGIVDALRAVSVFKH